MNEQLRSIQWTGHNIHDVMNFMHPQEPIYVNNLSHMKFTNADDLVGVATPDGLKVADRGHWIVRDGNGDLRVSATDPATGPTQGA